MLRIRPFRPGDEPALAEICLRTADAGADATGVLEDDDLWAEVFVLPYVARHPELAFVLADEAAQDRPIGYVVAALDTRSFEEWFRTTWWPERHARFPAPAPTAWGDVASGGAVSGGATPGRRRQDEIVRYAYRRRAGREPYGDDHPAHLHVDLLPAAQGSGWGRRLIETEIDALRRAGASGLHLVADAHNTRAVAFYERLGFRPLPSHTGARAFAWDDLTDRRA